MGTTRGSVLMGAAALATGGQLSSISPSPAAAPPAGKQAPGFYRYKVGDYELTQIVDGSFTVQSLDGFVTNADKNVTWTILALAMRTSEYIAGQRKAGAI